jgi:hypothetical protein
VYLTIGSLEETLEEEPGAEEETGVLVLVLGALELLSGSEEAPEEEAASGWAQATQSKAVVAKSKGVSRRFFIGSSLFFEKEAPPHLLMQNPT